MLLVKVNHHLDDELYYLSTIVILKVFNSFSLVSAEHRDLIYSIKKTQRQLDHQGAKPFIKVIDLESFTSFFVHEM